MIAMVNFMDFMNWADGVCPKCKSKKIDMTISDEKTVINSEGSNEWRWNETVVCDDCSNVIVYECYSPKGLPSEEQS